MLGKEFTTHFASPERSNPELINEDSKIFFDGSLFENLSDAIPDTFLILNENRQIVFANNRIAESLNLLSKDCLLGKRPGEALNCAYSDKNEAGCGTSEFCSECGVVKAILTAMKGISNIGECTILTKDNNAINLKVWASAFSMGERQFTAFAIADNSNDKLYHNLLRTFFHDVLNLVGGMSSLVEIINSNDNTNTENKKEYMQMLQDATKRLLADIEAQRQFVKICQGEFKVSMDNFNTLDILNSVRTLYQSNEVARDKKIEVLSSAINASIFTDQTLLIRVLGNMTKNALEASNIGQTVKLNCYLEENFIVFSVNNKKCMSREVQLQVFKRSFSTKGSDRGIGTYSMKLIGENFLKGSVYFASDENEGTTFFIKLPKNH